MSNDLDKYSGKKRLLIVVSSLCVLAFLSVCLFGVWYLYQGSKACRMNQCSSSCCEKKWASRYKAPDEEGSSQKTIEETSTSPQNTINAPIVIIPSLDGNYSFYFFLKIDSIKNSRCGYSVMNKAGFRYHTSFGYGKTPELEFNPAEEIPCTYDMRGFRSDVFKGWGEGNSFAIEFSKGSILIFELLEESKMSSAKDEFDYDPSELSFSAVNKNFGRWLFKKKNGSFVIFDGEHRVLVDNLKYSGRDVLYDAVNDGFVFTSVERESSDQPEWKERCSVEFMPVDTLKMRYLITTDWKHGVALSPGPAPAYVTSTPGEVVIRSVSFCGTVRARL